MTRLLFNKGEDLDEELLWWLNTELNITELRKQRSLHQLLTLDIIPNFKRFLSSINPELVSYMMSNNFISPELELLPGGVGYIAGIVISVSE